MTEISVKNLHKYFGAEHLLEDVSFEVNTGERVGLLGDNGTGKTTLFKIITKEMDYEMGSVNVASGKIIGVLDQMPNYPSHMTVYDVLKTIFNEVISLGERVAKLAEKMTNGDQSVLDEYGRALSLYEAMGGYTLDSTISKVCNGLGITEQMQNQTFDSLSGGEKTRINLARIILLKPDILLLDEPTNHLDIESLEWFEDFLNNYQGTALIISHDRYFLDKVIDKVVEIENKKAYTYEGNYTEFQIQKQLRIEQLDKQYENEMKQMKKLESAARRMRDWAQYSKNPGLHKKAAAMETRLQKMKASAIERPVHAWQMKATFDTDVRASGELFEFSNLSKKFGDKQLFANLNFKLLKGDKLAIVGANGTGKTTLLKIMLGQEKADTGFVKEGAYVKYSLLEQHVEFEDENHTVLQEMMFKLGCGEGLARNILGKYRFCGEDVFKVVANLSGGEKSRLRLAILMQNGINLLILDEPTNHLDINSREWLEDALEDFGGSLLFVSHDRYFISRFANKFLEISSEGQELYVGDYEAYIAHKEHVDNIKRLNAISNDKVPVKKENTKPKGFNPKTVEKKIEKLEKEIEALQLESERLTDEMEKNSADFLLLQELVEKADEVDNQMLEKMFEVEELNELLK